MLKEAVEKLMSEGAIPIVWNGMQKSPYVNHRDELDSHRNDGRTSFEQEETEDDLGSNDDMMDIDWDDEMETDPEMDDMDVDMDPEMDDMDVDMDEFGDLDDEDDPDRQGLIRVVPNAHLIYKRASEDGTYEELWIFNTGEQFDEELNIRRAILAGTDIEMNKMASKDGSQSYEMWNAGNAQMIKITGLPS